MSSSGESCAICCEFLAKDISVTLYLCLFLLCGRSHALVVPGIGYETRDFRWSLYCFRPALSAGTYSTQSASNHGNLHSSFFDFWLIVETQILTRFQDPTEECLPFMQEELHPGLADSGQICTSTAVK